MNEQNLIHFFAHIEQQLIEIPNEARRIFHGRGRCWEGLEQLTADWLQGQLVVTLFKEVEDSFIDTLHQGLMALTQTEIWQHKQGQAIVVQHRYQDGAPSEVLFGELDAEPVVDENDLKFQLKLGKNQNTGLFLDMRNGRKWVKDHAQGKQVLNLFAYTCGFSVAALAGGAKTVVNVDMARGALDTGRENHKLNNLDLRSAQFLAYDIFKCWGKITRYGPYDLIIIDPPSFQKGSFALTKDYQRILRRLPNLLTENGQVLACVNSPMVGQDFLISGMQEEAPALQFVERLENPQEFVDIDQDSNLKVLLFESSKESVQLVTD